MSDSNSPSTPAQADACPVDHKAREVWLAQARAAAASNTTDSSAPLPSNHPPLPSASTPAQTSSSWTASLRSYLPFTSSPSSSTTPQQPPQPNPSAEHGALDTHRVVSSIPRTVTPGASSCPADHASPSSEGAAAARPANSERDTGADPVTGNWVYPSEKMFFDAMRRKGLDGVRGEDMKTVVPIHNAVNERAWKEIREWEKPYVEGTACDGPRLHSFMGLSDRMSPKARLNTLLGYTEPFDRHDWVIDRCGVRIEYVIDFYAGRSGTKDASGRPSFYLDVRPKLNSWEGAKMRAARILGLV
ncbi:hypothetical protein ACRALDRAFT_1036056 [Sodiomyces alcalophilus JCM 7366]|uniref:uncharacterized protein n=1 Tax=Sodiomyces alcalophilus JCM 7366 TaxID=591952 RepID=UPI0039B437AE